MKIIVGLGNPGSQYAKTRHNAGFMVIDRLVSKHAPAQPARARFHAACTEADIAGEKCLLMKPTTYMNRSGLAVGEAVRFYRVAIESDLLIISDDVYLACGAIRLRPGGGAGGHNGLADIERALGTSTYPRLRLGVDAKPPFMDQADYVLTRFTPEQEPLIATAVDRAATAVETWATRGLAAAMNEFNRKEEPTE